MSEATEGVSAPAEVKHLSVALGFKLDAIASIGSAVALLVFTLITVAHVRIRGETGANVVILIAAIAAATVVLVTFVSTTLIHEPGSIVALVVILVLSIALDYWWKRSRTSRAGPIQVVPNPLEQG